MAKISRGGHVQGGIWGILRLVVGETDLMTLFSDGVTSSECEPPKPSYSGAYCLAFLPSLGT